MGIIVLAPQIFLKEWPPCIILLRVGSVNKFTLEERKKGRKKERKKEKRKKERKKERKKKERK